MVLLMDLAAFPVVYIPSSTRLDWTHQDSSGTRVQQIDKRRYYYTLIMMSWHWHNQFCRLAVKPLGNPVPQTMQSPYSCAGYGLCYIISSLSKMATRCIFDHINWTTILQISCKQCLDNCTSLLQYQYFLLLEKKTFRVPSLLVPLWIQF